jgi:hypothetical protein
MLIILEMDKTLNPHKIKSISAGSLKLLTKYHKLKDQIIINVGIDTLALSIKLRTRSFKTIPFLDSINAK